MERDWGWAPEYVDAMQRMLQQPEPRDLVLATGRSHPLETFVELTFAAVGLDWREHVDTDPALFRPHDIGVSRADPARAEEAIGWSTTRDLSSVVHGLVEATRPN